MNRAERRRAKRDGDLWDGDQVRAVLANPVYAGVGPYPAIVDESLWIAAAARDIAENGAESFLELMLEQLRASLDAVADTDQ